MYMGGTIPALQAGAVGRLDTTSETMLLFEFAQNKVVIPYANINSYEYTNQIARHLGILPAIGVGLVKKRQRKHFFRIIYYDESNVSQVAVFEVSKSMPQTLLAVLQIRSPQGCASSVTKCDPKN